MLTISKLLDAFTNPEKMKISQNKLASSFHTSPSTINAWIKKESQPQMDAAAFYDGINKCREDWTTYHNDFDFVEKIIEYLDISSSERELLNIQLNSYKKKYPSDEICTQKYLTNLIHLALSKKEVGYDLQYQVDDPAHPIIGIGIEHVIAVINDGRVLSAGADDFQQCSTHSWRNVVSVSAGWRSSVGLKTDGTCIAVGKNAIENGEIFRWTNMISVCCGTYHYLGLRRDGTVAAFGLGGDGQCDVSSWQRIISLAAGTRHSVGLCENGTVIACGSNSEGQCEVSSWINIKQIAAAGDHTIALTEDGRILLAGNQYIYDFSNWSDVISVATGLYHIVGLKKDGTVYHTGHVVGGLDSAYKWWDIKSIYAGYYTTVGITNDGNVLITNDKHNRTYLNSSTWNIYGEHKPQDAINSPFAISRKEIISVLTSIHELGLQLSPSLYESPLDAAGTGHLEEIRRLSKFTWELRERILRIKPLADILLRYNMAFLDFSKEFSETAETGLYHVSMNAYEVCIEFLTVISMLLVELRSL